jgi:hypothetical protein
MRLSGLKVQGKVESAQSERGQAHLPNLELIAVEL